MRLPRRFLVGKVYFISARVTQGLPFQGNRLLKKIIKGIIAKGQFLYSVPICHLQFMGNHFHMIVVCTCAYKLMCFYKYLKAELARATNKLSGKRGSVWYGRCDAPVLLTAEDVIEKASYLYTNPQQAHLVERIEQFPGVSSWNMFVERKHQEDCEWIPVRDIECGSIKEKEYQQYTLKITPDAWLESKEYQDYTPNEARERIIERVRSKERELYRERRVQGRRVVGRRRLEQQSTQRRYYPKKWGQRVCCICADVGLRRAYLEEFREFVERCREVYRRWCKGDFVEYPPGAFPAPVLELGAG